jgi:hypothetical protein
MVCNKKVGAKNLMYAERLVASIWIIRPNLFFPAVEFGENCFRTECAHKSNAP